MLRLVLVSGIFAIGLIGGIRSRFGALLLYVWFALFRPLDWMWVDVSRFRPSLILGLLVVVPCLFTGVMPVLSHPISIGALVFVGSALVAQVDAVNPEAGWYWLDFMAKLILVCLLGIRLTNTRRRVLLLVSVIAFSLGFHATKAGWAALIRGGSRYMEGVGGAFDDNNAYALGTVMLLPFLIAVAQNAPSRWTRRGVALMVPLAIVTVVSTFSRGALVALSAGSLILILLQRRRVVLLACAAVLLPALVFVTPLPRGYVDRMATIQTYEQVEDNSALGRLHFWRVALNMAADHPLGVGLWNFQANYDRYDFLNGRFGTYRQSHNSHLQALTETGWLGGAAWVMLFVAAFASARRTRRVAIARDDQFLFTMSNAMLASMGAFLVGGSFVSMALNDLTWLTFVVVASLDRLADQPATVEAQEPAQAERPMPVATWRPPARAWQWR